MNITETPFKHVWEITADIKDGDDYYSKGFYFVDETQQLQGPYTTLEEARKALKVWCKEILGVEIE